MDITNNIDKKIEEILYSDSGVPEMWAGSEESIPKDKRIGKLSQLLQESGEVEYERGVAHGKLQEALLQEEPIPETYISDTTEYPTNKEAKE